MARNDNEKTKKDKIKKRKPLLLTILFSPLNIIGFLLFGIVTSIVFSILIEWIALTFWWPDNPDHAKEMFFIEYSYINDDFKSMIGNYKPIKLIDDAVMFVYEMLYESRVSQSFLNWLHSPDSSNMSLFIKQIINKFYTYFSATGYIILTISLRAVIFLLSLPWFILCAALGVVNGLVEREIRKDEGGIEHAYIHHLVKDHKYLFITGAWVIYLSMPVSIHPSALLIPSGLLFGYTVYLTMWSFKKYL